MEQPEIFVILTNRKRAAVALAHSIVFLLIALRSLVLGKSLAPIWLHQSDWQASFGILLIYGIVASVLIQLARLSGTARERNYFMFCATSASIGTLRTIVGDPAPHLGLLLRVIMLLCAVAIGITIVRTHSMTLVQETSS